MITVDQVRPIALALPRAYETVVRDRITFRAGRLVFAAFSRDETVMGVGFPPKEEREAMVAAEPEKFLLPPRTSDMRYNWIHVRLDAVDLDEVRELVIDGWKMCVPKKYCSSDQLIKTCSVRASLSQRRRPTISASISEVIPPALASASPICAGVKRRPSVTWGVQWPGALWEKRFQTYGWHKS